MKKTKVMAAISLAVLLLSGCAGGLAGSRAFAPSQNSIYLTKDGGLQSALVQEYEKEKYLEEELKSFAEKEVVAYNKEKGSEESAYNQTGTEAKLPVAIESCSLKNNKSTLIFSYGSPQDLILFSAQTGDNSHSLTDVQIGDTSTPEGLALLTQAQLLDKNGKVVAPGEIGKQKRVVVEMEGKATILTESKILYRSENVTLVDDHTVTTPEEGRYIIVY